MKYTLVKPDGSIGETKDFDVCPDIAPNKGKWLPDNPPAYNQATHYALVVSPQSMAQAEILYDVQMINPFVPPFVSMRQARLALLNAGLLTTVNAAVAAMAGVEGDAARIEWEYATTVERNSPLVVGLGAALSLSNEQLDQLFVAAGGL